MNNYPIYKKCSLSRASRFRFRWLDGNTSLNDNGIKIINTFKNNHPYCYILQKLYVLVSGRWCPVEYSHIKGDTWEMIIWHL